MANEELEKRIAMLEDIEAIKKLKARYCLICDDNHNPAEITNLFAADGIWEGDGIGPQQGHAAIRALFQKFQERIAFSQHNVFNPIIKVDGDRAKGSWYFLGPFTFRKGNRQMWLAARYEEDYVKVNGEWKFQHLRAIGRMAAPYEIGWAKKDVA
ncbi:MAG TPA: nuclear transport factor 2 family protein [Candidatus Binataceae bacterium]|nr:nuclear transport factor 2 family protein [Candidatus Binataceae bacterium]